MAHHGFRLFALSLAIVAGFAVQPNHAKGSDSYIGANKMVGADLQHSDDIPS